MKPSYAAVRKAIYISLALAAIFFALNDRQATSKAVPETAQEAAQKSVPLPLLTEISGVINKNETFYDIFKRNGLNQVELYRIAKASTPVYDLGRVARGRAYGILVDDERCVKAMTYSIDDDWTLDVTCTEKGFSAAKSPVLYKKKTAIIGGVIKNNLVSSVMDIQLALALSDIFAWDIDFNTDLREGDTFKLAVEELWLDGKFKKYGSILGAEFMNNGRPYFACMYEQNGESDYYDRSGKSLRRAFLKAPLSYRRISSGYSKKRFHPVLKTYRPHLGVDYSARRGTPVSSVGDGTVVLAGRRGQNGKQVVVRHPNGYKTYYGHLSQIKRGIRKGRKVKQGQVIGYVGSTGLASGPHLDYRIKRSGRFVNPLRLKLPRGGVIKAENLSEFEEFKEGIDKKLATLTHDPQL
jgi:murein DD-endopeptidase MepM/ murein hydrolase activator NlpD